MFAAEDRNPESVLGVVTRLRVGKPTNRFQLPRDARDFTLLQSA
jgi:hypothetical protein